MDLVPYIRELILLNECVILRGVGGFETQYKQATLDKKKNILVPPSKSITFRPDWIKDNGVLEDHLMKTLGINRDKASELIDSFTKDFYEQLKTTGELKLEGIGIFSFDNRSVVQFSEFEDANYLADSFGLDVLEMQTESTASPDSVQDVLIPVTQTKRKLTGWYVAIGILILVISVTFIIIISENSSSGIAGFSDHSKSGASGVLVIGSNDTDTSDPVMEAIEESLDKQTIPQKALAPDIQKDNTQSDYYLIAGSFKNIRNAEILRDQLARKGFAAQIQETGINYRVVIGQFTNRRNAINELRRMRSQLDQSVWLLEEKGDL